MNIEIKIIDAKSDDVKKMLELRDEILRKPLGLSIYDDKPDNADDVHLGAYLSNRLVGCLILTKVDSNIVRMRQVAVKQNIQRQGIGKRLIIAAEVLARIYGYKKIILQARLITSDFYKKLKYQQVGEEFIEKTIPHINMEKTI